MAMQTQQLAKLLESEGLRVVQLATNRPYRPGWIARIPGLRAVFRLLPYLWHVWRLAAQCDVIHVMANSGWSWQLFSAPVLWISPWRGTPVVVNYRGGEAESYFNQSIARVRPSILRAHTIVVPSRYLETVFRQFELDTQVIPNIIDLDMFGVQSKNENRNVTLVITRNLEAIYGIDVAVKAMSLLVARYSNLELKIAGSGPQEQALRALIAELNLQDHVQLMGRLERHDIVQLYQSADIMLNPTTVDNMPNSLLEALACALPIVSTNVGGVPYMVEHRRDALLVDPKNPQALADALQELIESPALREELVRNGLETVAQYSWEHVRTKWLACYESASAPS
jgi:glycosyltransferase involved in cell wall biosynthesis